MSSRSNVCARNPEEERKEGEWEEGESLSYLKSIAEFVRMAADH